MSYLIVVAHPDDEVLGAGATIRKLTQQGEEVNVCVLCGQAQARAGLSSELDTEMRQCLDMLGVKDLFVGNFPNIKMNTTAHLELVQFIEKAIMATGASHIITHHPADVNNDHHHTAIACQAAARLFQRRSDVPKLKELLFMEVASSTEWALDPSVNAFRPNTFVETGKEGIDYKIQALACYKGVMRPYPHPRSEEAILGLAAFRGSQAGVCYAEAFETAFRSF